jgi:hypothetical protein
MNPNKRNQNMKSYQVLLPRWLERPVKKRVDQLEISFSEVLRVQVCLAVLAFQKVLYPEYQPGKELDYYLNTLKGFIYGKPDKDAILDLYSDIYFETRKALEYRENQEKKAERKSKGSK